MGKGDRKSKRGKIFMGSYGNSRKRKKKNKVVSAPRPKAVKPVKAETKPADAVEAKARSTAKKAVKKPAAKKAAAPKKEAKPKKAAAPKKAPAAKKSPAKKKE
jgi:ribosomal small subunit protein bTHX